MPKFLVLDSATLGNISKDYWSTDPLLRGKARSFISDLSARSVHLAFTLTNVCEVIRYEDDAVVENRIAFLRALPLIAWLRPFDRSWFTGCIVDLLIKELDAFRSGVAKTWDEIISHVRTDLWETATGEELFGFTDFWSTIREYAKEHVEEEKYVASIARTDPGNVFDIKLCDIYALPLRDKQNRTAHFAGFAANLKNQLDRLGDPKLKDSRAVALDFTKGVMQTVNAIDQMGGDALEHLMNNHNVPQELIDPKKMTMAQLGELSVYASQLKIFAEKLPSCRNITMLDVPMESLPTYVLGIRLSRIQQKMGRVTGSNLGDRYLASMVFYADGLDVDKRTEEFLKQVQRSDPALGKLMQPFFRGSDYSTIPTRFD